MKTAKLIILISILLFSKSLEAQPDHSAIPDGVYYIVRHAEKDSGKNPVLAKAGYARAGDLYRKLKDKKISKIFVSQYRRTQLTADSLRIYQKADTVHYVADATGDDLMKQLAKQTKLKRPVLIIGHSNTIPAILKKLGVTGLEISELPDNEHDNLFMVTVKSKKVSLKWLKYGKPPTPTNSGAAMQPLQ